MDNRFPLHDGYVLSPRLARLANFAYVASPLMDKREHSDGISKLTTPRQLVELFKVTRAEVIMQTRELPAADRVRENRTPNHAMQRTAGRRSASLSFMNTRPLQFPRGPASGG